MASCPIIRTQVLPDSMKNMASSILNAPHGNPKLENVCDNSQSCLRGTNLHDFIDLHRDGVVLAKLPVYLRGKTI